jgi:myo-inositol 2-dehydrogenase/D-chiro-inositol 1-dehydrogenase
MGVHDFDLMRWFLGGARALRASAMGTIAIHDGLAATGDHDNAMAMIEFEGGGLGLVYNSRTLAHGHETMTEVVGTAGRLAVGANPRIDRVEIADAHGVRNACTPTFYERFAEAFELEAQAFAQAALGIAPPPLTLRDATEATRIGVAVTQALRSGGVVTL